MGKRIANAVSSALVALVLVFAASLLVFRVMGGGAYAVLSSSMEPAYPVGSLIYVQPVDSATLQTGDVITFALAENLTVTHRIAAVAPDESNPNSYWFTTKGDANDSTDASPVHSENVIGKPVLCIPFLGYVINFVSRPPGIYLAVGAIIALILVGFFVDISHKKRQITAIIRVSDFLHRRHSTNVKARWLT